MAGADGKEPVRPRKSPIVSQAEKPKGTVLVMDDDESVCGVVAAMLQAAGYEAEFARTGEEALQKYRKGIERGSRYQAVFMDLRIPGGMGAEETLQSLRELDPQVKGVVMTGDVGDPVVQRSRDLGFEAVLEKPFGLEDMKAVLSHLFG